LAHHGMSHDMAEAYAKLWRTHGITHALTISPGVSASGFDADALTETLKRLVRDATHQMRGLSRRRLRDIDHRDPNLVFIAGFIEGETKTGSTFMHMHGGVALRPLEEIAFRNILWERIGEDRNKPLQPLEPTRTTNPLSPTRVPLTFDFQRLKTAPLWQRYSTKHAVKSDFAFISTNHLLA
ncbi:MAG: hypothetical protein ACK4S3_05330, partial [Parvibaculum sp.]